MKYYCPTQDGQFIGYQAEFKNRHGEWERCKNPEGAISYPKMFGGILSTIYLYGYAQATAICWLYHAAFNSIGQEIETRTVAYEITYDIKAERMG